MASALAALVSGRAQGVPRELLHDASPGLRLVLQRLAERSVRRQAVR